jgi:tetratricopeptide (TPR) repeat protein
MATIPFDEHTSKGVLGNAAEGGGVGAVWAAEIGDGKTSAEMLAAMRRAGEYYVKGLSPEGFSVRLGTELRARFESLQAEAAGDYGRMREIAQASLERLAKATASNDGQRRRIADLTASAHYAVARAAFQAGDDRAAEAAGREAVRLRSAVPARNSDEEGSEADARVLLAAALGRQGRAAEASEALAPALAFHRRITAKGNDSMLERLALAQCLHAAALAHPDKARAHLAEAQRQLDSLPAEMQARRSVTVVRHWIAQDKTGRRARG